MKKQKTLLIIGDIIGVLVTAVVFLVPFYFMFVQSLKSKAEANKLSISWPSELHFENYIEVFKHGNYQLVTAFKNSGILALFTVLGLLVTAAMAAYVIQRRHDKTMNLIQSVIMLGLMIPAAILPTIKLLQSLHIYIPYLERVIAAKGESVIVPRHADYWGVYDNVPVYSLMKALRGEGMGFLEVECRMDSLEKLEQSDPDVGYLMIVNKNELLYASNEEYGNSLKESDFERISKLKEDTVFTRKGDVYIKAMSADYDLTVLAYKENYLMKEERQQFFLVSFMIALMTFGVSLMLVFFWADILTRPVKRLQEIVENTNIENLQDNRQLEKAKAMDEFKELINSYQAMTTRLDKAVQEEKRATTLQLQAQFNMLQAQVNPHFIYNVLNTISSRAILANDEVICEICGSFGNMLRYSTSNKERYASVEQELEYLESYFYLLKARHGERLEVSMDVDEEVRKQIIPKMTLQQLVENSVKHGLQTMDKSIHISVTGRMERDGWTIRIQDNGLGMTEEKLLEVRKRLKEVHKNIQKKTMAAELEIGGMGIVNTYARCMLLYSEDLIFELGNISEGHGFVVTVGKKMIDKDNQL